MYIFKLFIIKVLKRLKVLPSVNFDTRKRYNNTIVVIPFIKGMGIENFLLKEDWLDILIKTFVDETKGAFIDVGVNIGQTLIKVKSKYPNIEYIGFEPNTACIFYTQFLILKNSYKKCNLQSYALTTKITNLTIEKTSISDLRASIVPSLRPNYFETKEMVLGMVYDSLFVDTPISFVKIDAEGAELDVILGMRSAIEKHKPIITCEVLDSFSPQTHEFTQDRATKLSDLLTKDLNYRIVNIETQSERIVAFKVLDRIIIKQWKKESGRFNDYLFIPKNKLDQVCEKILTI
jgi:FkbM family methyltransferase